ncbi:MAG: DUF4157 domain-containing protein [Opitutae bacterium]|nr:DUF4157 domain-containing protein [Opitutae bacterium]
MTPIPLPPLLAWLRSRLRAQIDGSLDGIHLAGVERLPVAAFAFGDLIAVSAAALRGPARELLPLVAHELAHVFQQRSGRTAPGGVVCDPTLEAEAAAAARAVARGERLRLSAPRARALHPVLQPSLTIDGAVIASASDLSATCQHVAALVPQANAWLAWAMTTPAAHLAFANESALINGIEQGLHGTNTRLFAGGVQFDVTILFSLGQPDFGNVVASLASGALTPAALAALAARGVRTEAEFAQIPAFFAGRGLAVPPQVAAANLAEKVALVAALDRWTATPAEAAVAATLFAQAQTATASAFIAAWDFHASVTAAGGGPDAAPQLWEILSPLAWPMLSCPALPSSVDDGTLVAILARERAGFATVAHALANYAAYTGIPLAAPLDLNLATARVDAYLAAARTIAATGTCSITRLQDGATRWIDFAASVGRARFQHDATGLLTLLQLVPASA